MHSMRKVDITPLDGNYKRPMAAVNHRPVGRGGPSAGLGPSPAEWPSQDFSCERQKPGFGENGPKFFFKTKAESPKMNVSPSSILCPAMTVFPAAAFGGQVAPLGLLETGQAA